MIMIIIMIILIIMIMIIRAPGGDAAVQHDAGRGQYGDHTNAARGVLDDQRNPV